MSDTTNTKTTAVVRRQTHGLNHGVPEWPEFSYTGKPVVITQVTVAYSISAGGVEKPQVNVIAYPLKKDGTPMAQTIREPIWDSSILYFELVKQYGAQAKIDAQAVWQTLYG